MTSLANGLPFHADFPPLRVDEGGAVRIGNSRINLDLTVEQYENGMTPEDMVRAYVGSQITVPSSGLVYFDANPVIYSVEKHPV